MSHRPKRHSMQRLESMTPQPRDGQSEDVILWLIMMPECRFASGDLIPIQLDPPRHAMGNWFARQVRGEDAKRNANVVAGAGCNAHTGRAVQGRPSAFVGRVRGLLPGATPRTNKDSLCFQKQLTAAGCCKCASRDRKLMLVIQPQEEDQNQSGCEGEI